LSQNSNYIVRMKKKNECRRKNKQACNGFRIFPCACFLILILCTVSFAQNKFENRSIERVTITFEGNDRDLSAAEQFTLIVKNALGNKYSTVRIRDALARLYETKRIISAKVEAENFGQDRVLLRFIVKRKSLAKKISIRVANSVGETVTEQELLLRLNLLTAGNTITERVLQQNANVILTYLRERGFFSAEVEIEQKPVGSEIDVEVIFKVNPNTQARVKDFRIDIDKFEIGKVRLGLKLGSGVYFSRRKLMEDIEKIRSALRDESYLAPRLNEPRVVYDGDRG